MDEEQKTYLDTLTETLGKPSPETETYFSRMRAEGVIVGDDENGDLVRLDANGMITRLSDQR